MYRLERRHSPGADEPRSEDAIMEQTHARPGRGWSRAILGAAVVLLGCLGLARSAPPVDLVEQLQRALNVRPGDTINPTPQFYRYREETLQNLVKRLQTVGDLRRALA